MLFIVRSIGDEIPIKYHLQFLITDNTTKSSVTVKFNIFYLDQITLTTILVLPQRLSTFNPPISSYHRVSTKWEVVIDY